MKYRQRTKFEGDNSSSCPQHQGADSCDCRPERFYIDVLLPNSYFKELLLGNLRDREIVQNMSPGDSSLRTSSVWLAIVTGENV